MSLPGGGRHSTCPRSTSSSASTCFTTTSARSPASRADSLASRLTNDGNFETSDERGTQSSDARKVSAAGGNAADAHGVAAELDRQRAGAVALRRVALRRLTSGGASREKRRSYGERVGELGVAGAVVVGGDACLGDEPERDGGGGLLALREASDDERLRPRRASTRRSQASAAARVHLSRLVEREIDAGERGERAGQRGGVALRLLAVRVRRLLRRRAR